MKSKYIPKYPLIWEKGDFFIKIFCSIPNIATGIILKTAGSNFVIDPGDGILRDLKNEIGKEGILKVNNIFVSHGHHDHLGGLWSLLTYLSVMRRQNGLNIYFPKGCTEIKSIYKAFVEVYDRDLSYKINMIAISDETEIPVEDVVVEPFWVNHRELEGEELTPVQIPSLGFKFLYDGNSICYGGDTAYCDTLVEKAAGSDLAIIEAGAEEEDDSDLHMTMDQAIEIGESAKEFFLVHVPE